MAIIEAEFLELTRGFDAEAFWQENALCTEPTTSKPRCSASLPVDDHWLFEFMAVPSTLRYYREKSYRDALHRQANELTRQYLGIAYFDEDSWVNSPRRIENLFGCDFAYTENATPWLTHVTDDPTEFARVLDRAEETDMSTWAFPEAYMDEWNARRQAGKPLPTLGGGGRGPATVMTSVLQPETYFYWIEDHPELMHRFSDVLARKMIELNEVLRGFSGNTARAWWILDDNSCLFSPQAYRDFCFPALKRVMDHFAPAGAFRYQHSDSAMGHLLDLQRELGICRVNYGPEIDVRFIRNKMPGVFVDGHMPPFLLRNGTPEQIRQRIADDFAHAGCDGGLNVTTAGSVAAGTGLGRMRWFMYCVSQDCRYDG